MDEVVDDSQPFQLDPALLAGFAADNGFPNSTAASTTAQSGGESAPGAAAKRPARWKSLAFAGGCLTLGLFGGIGGQFLTAAKKVEAPAEDKHAAAAHHSETVHDNQHMQAEEWIRAGQYADGLKKLPEKPGPHEHQPWYLRGLCLEGLKQYPEARVAYMNAADPEGDAVLWSAALLGQVRCILAEQDWDQARNTLAKVELRSGVAGCVEAHIPSECAYLRGRLDLLRLGQFPEPEPLNADAVAWPSFPTKVEAYLDWLASKHPPAHAEHDGKPAHNDGHAPKAEHPAKDDHAQHAAPDDHDKPASPSIEIRNAADGKGLEVTAPLPSTPVLTLLKEIAAAGKWKLLYTPEQEAKLRTRTSPLAVEKLPLPVVLAALLEPQELSCEITADSLILIPYAPAAKPALRERARQAFARSVALAPEHPFARRALLAVANLDFLDGQHGRAVAGYRRIQELNRLGEETTSAVFNLGLAHLKLNNPVAAHENFLETVDRGSGGRWTDLGWYWMGRADLDAGDTRSAFRPFRSALAGKSKDARSAAAIALVLCHLLQADTDEAQETFRKQRIAPTEAHAIYTKLFEELFRYRTTPSELRAQNLHAAIAACGEAKNLGPSGMFLVGELYREIGQGKKMEVLFERELARAQGPWAVRMTFAAALQFEADGQSKEARQRYLAVSVIEPFGLGLKAELRLAGMAAREGRGAECLARCKHLVGKPGIETVELLPVMGRGYELERNPRLAAECFAGRVPVN